MKLIQKQPFKSTREFEIVDDVVQVRIKSLLKEEKLTVSLSTIEPEPVINGSELAFYSRYKGKPVLSLLLNKPNAEQFNAFVDTLKKNILGDEGIDAATHETSQPEAPGWNVYDEPPEFDKPGETEEKVTFQPVNVERLEGDINMLKTYLDESDIMPLLDSLETLKADPGNEAAFRKMMDVYNDMGVNQGAVLTYAPYLKVLLSKSIWK